MLDHSKSADPRPSVTASGERSVAIGGALGDGIIVTGDSNIAIVDGYVVGHDITVGQENTIGHDITVGGDITIFNESIHHLPVISEEQAFQRIGAAVRLNLRQLQSNMEQARRESSQFFRLTLVFSSLGFLMVLGGVALLLLNEVTVGVVTSSASIIPEVTAALFFKKDKEMRKTIEAYHQHMMDSQQVLTMIDVAETIRDHAGRDTMKQRIIFKVLDIKP
jgi:hypothetical protein